MAEERKHAILFSATILAARKLAEIGDKLCPAREMCLEHAIRNAERILRKMDTGWPATSDTRAERTVLELAFMACSVVR